MTKPPTLSLVLPLYNEAEHLRTSLPLIGRYLDRLRLPYEIVLVEDKSTDRTLDIAKVFARCKHIRLLEHPKNRGRGKSVRDGVIAARGKIVGYIDVDLETSPLFISEMIDPILNNEADMTIGYRIYNVHPSTLLRFLLSRGYFYLVRWWLRLPFNDTEAGYKFFNRKRAQMALRTCRDCGWFFDTEVVARAYFGGLRVKEIPVLFLRNRQKKSTVQPLKDSLVYLWRLWEFRRVMLNSKLLPPSSRLNVGTTDGHGG
jgi:dolichyl-phosphate beta-glucosyltransferase